MGVGDDIVLAHERLAKRRETSLQLVGGRLPNGFMSPQSHLEFRHVDEVCLCRPKREILILTFSLRSEGLRF